MDLLTRFKDKEKALRSYMPDARYIAIRIDGKAFHSYTKGLDFPVDKDFVEAMNRTTKVLCKEVSGTVLGYAQSDEITLFIDAKVNEGTQPWLGGAIQKLTSISASIATAHFNVIRAEQGHTKKIAFFDARVIDLESKDEVGMYCDWRRADAIKNSTSMAAEAHFSPRQLAGKNSLERREMLADAGHPWEELPEGFRFGRFIVRQQVQRTTVFTPKNTNETQKVTANRTVWKTVPATETSKEEYLQKFRKERNK